MREPRLRLWLTLNTSLVCTPHCAPPTWTRTTPEAYESDDADAAKNITQDTLERYLAKAGARIEPSTDASRDLAGLAGTITDALLSAGTVFPAGIVNPHEAAESAARAAEIQAFSARQAGAAN